MFDAQNAGTPLALSAVIWIILLCFAGILSRVLPEYRRAGSELLARPGFHVGLESLRGILALSVVVHHLASWRSMLTTGHWEIEGPHASFLTQLGTAPVTMFFFLTGFLFWSRLKNKPHQHFREFMRARLRRLGPAYLASAALLFLLVAVFTHFHPAATPAQLLVGLVEWSGFTVAGSPILNGYAATGYLWPVVWTLRLEILFYLLLPFLGWFAQSLGRTLLFIAIAAATYYPSLAISPNALHIPKFYLLQAFCGYLAYSFSGGMIAAHAVRIPAVKKFAKTRFASFVAAAGIVLVLWFVPPVHGPLESSLLLGPFVVIAAGNDLFGALKTRTLLFLGQISYSIYLVHCLVLAAFLAPIHSANNKAYNGSSSYAALAIALSILVLIVATISHRFFEWPFMHDKKPERKLRVEIAQERLDPALP